MHRTAHWLAASALLLPCLLLGTPHLEAQSAAHGAQGHPLFPVQVLHGAPDAVPEGLPGILDEADPATILPAALQDRRARGTRWMIGGAVAVVVGSVLGGDGGTLLIVGGVVAAGYGFYLYHEP
jgi:hypothetical protein